VDSLPTKWSTVDHRSGAGLGKSAGQTDVLTTMQPPATELRPNSISSTQHNKTSQVDQDVCVVTVRDWVKDMWRAPLNAFATFSAPLVVTQSWNMAFETLRK